MCPAMPISDSPWTDRLCELANPLSLFPLKSVRSNRKKLTTTPPFSKLEDHLHMTNVPDFCLLHSSSKISDRD